MIVFAVFIICLSKAICFYIIIFVLLTRLYELQIGL